jgi:hypothetical protein
MPVDQDKDKDQDIDMNEEKGTKQNETSHTPEETSQTPEPKKALATSHFFPAHATDAPTSAHTPTLLPALAFPLDKYFATDILQSGSGDIPAAVKAEISQKIAECTAADNAATAVAETPVIYFPSGNDNNNVNSSSGVYLWDQQSFNDDVFRTRAIRYEGGACERYFLVLLLDSRLPAGIAADAVSVEYRRYNTARPRGLSDPGDVHDNADRDGSDAGGSDSSPERGGVWTWRDCACREEEASSAARSPSSARTGPNLANRLSRRRRKR